MDFDWKLEYKKEISVPQQILFQKTNSFKQSIKIVRY